MKSVIRTVIMILLAIPAYSGFVHPAELDDLLSVMSHEISGSRTRDYTMRLWQYDKWSTLPMWKKSSEEVKTIMEERGFDEAKLVETPADGVTRVGDWINPLGWDARDATLEVIEPANLPDEYRYLCNYRDNPTSLGCWSAPMPPEGIEAELVVLERSNPELLKTLDARGKIILVSSNSRGLKRYLDRYGILGIVSDQIEGHSRDSVNENNWLNGWSDIPGGWLMIDSDSKKNIRFSISQNKANYLRNLIRQGKKVRVRAKVDSRYYTDDTLPYTTGFVRGSGSEGEEVLASAHNHEWGASDNAAGSAAILEAVGTINDLINSGKLPRPRRGIRVWIGSEIYGSIAFAGHNLERLQKKTVAAVSCDDGAGDYDLMTSAVTLVMNPNCCPTCTDAVITEIARRYYSKYQPDRLFKTVPYQMADTFFCEPMIGVPTNWIYPRTGGTLHHNSSDTIEKVDVRSLRDMSILAALYLYYLADADFDQVPFMTDLTFSRGLNVIADKSTELNTRLRTARDGAELGKMLADGTEIINYYAGLQGRAVENIVRFVAPDRKAQAQQYLDRYASDLKEYGALLAQQFTERVNEEARAGSVKIIPYKAPDGIWEREAASIIPKRSIIVSLSLSGIPPEEWVEVSGLPRWWSANDWASSSYWWVDGKRNLNEIRKLCELEAGIPVRNFDLIKYYRFLEQHDLVEFVK
ncbi:M28 family peptidase [bacterium]|nr:M28 family peptidase [bacterium]